jgi:hypothetical protein
MAVTVNLNSHNDLITPQKEVLWLLELTAIETCDIANILLHLAPPLSMACANQPKQFVENE